MKRGIALCAAYLLLLPDAGCTESDTLVTFVQDFARQALAAFLT